MLIVLVENLEEGRRLDAKPATTDDNQPSADVNEITADDTKTGGERLDVKRATADAKRPSADDNQPSANDAQSGNY